MKEFRFDGLILRGACTVVVEANSLDEAIEKVKNGDLKEVYSDGWEYGDVDLNSGEEY